MPPSEDLHLKPKMELGGLASAHLIPHCPIPAEPPLMHAGEHRHSEISVVIDQHLGLAFVAATASG